MYRYIKNYEGDLTRKNGKTSRDYRFADEKEWRYVPSIADDLMSFVPLDKIKTTEQKAGLNAKISNRQLRFGPEDIQYLIVEKDAERSELIEHLENAKHRFDEVIRRRVASRILTADQIENEM